MDHPSPAPTSIHESIHAGAHLVGTEAYAQLEPAAAKEIDSMLQPVHLPAGSTLFRQGDKGDELYVVTSGRLAIRARTPMGVDLDLDEARPGDWIGEMALLTGQPRSATVTALEDATLVGLSRENFTQLRQRHPEIAEQVHNQILPRTQRRQLIQAFERLFGKLDMEVLRQLEQQVEWVRLAPGETLIRQGEPSDALYVLVTGLLHVFVEKEDKGGEDKGEEDKDGEGKQRFLRELHAWEIVGELGLFSDQPRTATVIAARAGEAIKLSRAAFETFITRHPHALLQIASTMATRQITSAAPPSPISRPATFTFAVITLPGAPAGVPLGEVAARLGERLGNLGAALVLDAPTFEQLYGRPNAAQSEPGDALDLPINTWLREQEACHRFLVFKADTGTETNTGANTEGRLSPWARRVLRHADRILLVAWAQSDPALRPVEAAIQEMNLPARRELILLHPAGQEFPEGTQRWLAPRSASTHKVVAYHHVRVGHLGDEERMARRLAGQGIGLVLGGGGARGVAHAGVIRALEEAGIPIDIVGGTSMGAMLAASYAEYDTAERVRQQVDTFSRRSKIFDRTLPFTSLMKGAKIVKLLKSAYGERAIEDLWRPYFCVSTNLSRARANIHESGPLWLAVRKSMSIPGVFPPVLQENDSANEGATAGADVVVDGSVINNFPADIMAERPDCGTIIGVSLVPAEDKVKHYRYGLALSGWSILWSRLLPWKRGIRAPSLVGSILRTQEINSVIYLRANRKRVDLLIEPEVAGFSMSDYDAHDGLIAAGYKAARKALAAWKNGP